MKTAEAAGTQTYTSKKCPHCHVYLNLEDKRCFSCKKRIGKADKNGIAKKSFDWLAYVICILSWSVFIFYIWWAFLRS